MTMKDAVPVAISDCHQLLVWLIPQLDQFPRVRRFTLGEKLEKALLEVLEHLLDAAYQRPAQKGLVLQQANRKLALARHLWRLGFELKSCPFKAYHHGADMMVGLGRQIGGWRKSVGGAATHA
jgi:hypothetical protein